MDRVKAANRASTSVLLDSARAPGGDKPAFDQASLNFELLLLHSKELDKETRRWVIELCEANMKSIYEASECGWSREEKESDLFHQDSRFLIAMDKSHSSEQIRDRLGYVMWRFDWEESAGDEDVEVAYCYELQLEPSAQRKGVGTALVEALEKVGRAWSMRKVILTVFKHNASARRFYSKIGFTNDEICPTNYVLEKSDVSVDYLILSKPL